MRSGSLRVRAADPKAEREAILRVLEKNLPRAVQPGRYDWLYLGNPRGPALVWVAEDESTGAVVGVSAAHRRRVRVRGVVTEALNLGDFAIDPEYRALGPALQLLRATLEPVREGRFAFSFDHMNDAMQAAYRRIEGASFGQMERFVRPVRASGYARRRWGAGLRGTLLGAAGNAVLRLKDCLVRPARGVRVAEHEGAFPEEFTRFDDARAAAWPVTSVRDAAYLTWRFSAHPVWRHRTLVARRKTGIAGYAIYREGDDGGLSVVELNTDEPGAMLAELLRRVRARGGESLGTAVLAGSAAERFFRSCGFKPRGHDSAAVCCAPPGSPASALVGDPASWWMVEGDRDV